MWTVIQVNCIRRSEYFSYSDLSDQAAEAPTFAKKLVSKEMQMEQHVQMCYEWAMYTN